MIEIGCASGAFLHRMAAGGWRVSGVEFSPLAGAHARRLGHDVYVGALETAPDPDVEFDLAVGWMVLEHLRQPVDGLARLRRWVRRGGWLALSVPNAGALEFRVFGPRWYALQLPTHLTHFSPWTLQLVLERSGWVVERLFHQRNISNLFASVGYVLEDRETMFPLANLLQRFPEASGVTRYATYPLAALMAWLGQTGRMIVWARNPG